MPPQQQGMMQQPGMGMGMQQPGMGMQQPGMGMQQPGMMQQQQQMMNSGMMMNMNSPPDLIQEEYRQQIVAFDASKDVGGIIRLRVPPGKKAEHLGIKVQFIGRIDMVRYFVEWIFAISSIN